MGKTFVLAIAVAAAALGGCGGARSDGGGPRVERSYQVGQFDRIEVAGHYDVDVRTGAAPSVRASGAERDLQRLVVEVRSGKLSIHSRKHDGMSLGWSGHGPVRVAVTVPNLKAAQIAGSGELDIDRIAGESFEGVVAGSGSMRLGQLEVGRAKLAIAGAGEIRAQAGRAENAEYAIAGSGDLDVAGGRRASGGDGGRGLGQYRGERDPDCLRRDRRIGRRHRQGRRQVQREQGRLGQRALLVRRILTMAPGKDGPMTARLALALLLAALASPAPAAERNFTVTSFDRVRVDGPFKVSLRTGTSPFARVKGSQAAIDRVSLAVQGRTLVIRQSSASWGGYPGQPAGPVEISAGTHELAAAWVNGSGALAIDRIEGLSFDLSVQGSGSATVGETEVDQLKVAIGGSASATLAGTAPRLVATVRGTSTLDSAALAVKDATLTADGPSVIRAMVTNGAKIDARGPSTVEIEGGAACTVSAQGSAAVRGCR